MEKILNMYTEEELDRILKDINKLSSLYINSINIKNKETSEVEPRNITRAIEKYIKKLVLSTDMQNDKRLENYKKVIISSLKQDHTYIDEIEFLKLPKERILGIMSEETYNQFSSYKANVKDYCTKIYDKILQNKKLSSDERHILMKYLYSNVGTRDTEIYKMQETMIKMIMNKEREYDYYDANFLVSFISYEESKENGYEVTSNVAKFTEKNKSARGFASEYRVNINVEYALNSLNSKNKEDLANLLHTICHEVAHTKQNNDISTGVCNKDTLDILTDKIFRQELSKDAFKYYQSNYYFETGEKDAEKTGFIHANKYIDRYLEDPNKKEEIENYLYNRKDHELYVEMISMRRDYTNEKVDADKFKIEKMEEILKRDNSYLTRFPLYKHIYNDNGELKSFSERLIAYSDFKKNNNEDSNDIFLSSFNYSIDNNDINNIDFSNMSKEELFKTMHSLSELYNIYSGMSHNALESTKQNDRFLDGERDIRNAKEYRDKKISIMASRYGKLEKILDVFYEKLGDEYKTNEEYSYDKFIYDKDKNYVRHKFSKIKEERQKRNKEELKEMLEETDNQISSTEDMYKK